MNRVIAVDFDGTLCKGKWPDIGEENTEVIEALKKRQADGDILILWTCRDGDLLQAAVMWCLARGLKFDAINDNCRQRVEMYGNNPRKVSADEYWDDRGVIVRHGKIHVVPWDMKNHGEGKKQSLFGKIGAWVKWRR